MGAKNTLDFSTHLSFDDFKLILDHENMRPDRTYFKDAYNNWINKSIEYATTIMQVSAKSYLLALKQGEKIVPVPNSNNIATPFIKAWNTIAKSENEEEVRRHIDRISKRFGRLIRVPHFNKMDPIEDQYKDFCAYMTHGNFDWCEFNVLEECFITGEELVIEFANWNCLYGKYGVHGEFISSEPSPDRPTVFHLPFELKTGNLLIADWFRIEEFTNTVDGSNDSDSICSEVGRERKTKKYAEEFNFISVSVGNTSPRILEVDGTFLFGSINKDIEEGSEASLVAFKEHGYVCTDLWNATIIEEETLVEIVASKVGYEKAALIVADYLSKNDAARMSVNPGQYHLYFHGNCEGFKKSFSSDYQDFTSVCRPLFVISNKVIEKKSFDNSIASTMSKKSTLKI